MFDALDTIKADADQTGGSFSLFELLDFKGSTVPLHIHERWDRGFYVLEGEYTFFVRDDVHTVTAGAWVFVPRATPHAWRCDSTEGKLLNLTVPGGFEGFYREVGENVTDRRNLPPKMELDFGALSGAAAKYGVTIVGPPPET
jgi:mannose-6-phosphate isomerase-like protein (cupin superfamily)